MKKSKVNMLTKYKNICKLIHTKVCQNLEGGQGIIIILALI